MKSNSVLALISFLVLSRAAQSQEHSLSWWMLPENTAELPHEIEEDDALSWTEMWYRADGDTSNLPILIMEQGLGVRWMGTDFDKKSQPGQAYLVFGGNKVVHITREKDRVGTINSSNDQILWADNSMQQLVDFKKKRKRRGRRSRGSRTRVNFGKIALPPAESISEMDLNPWSTERFNSFLEALAKGPEAVTKVRNRSAVAQMEDQNGSLLGFRYSQSCSLEQRAQVEDAIAKFAEPKLSCLAAQDKVMAQKLFAVLLQRPVIECKPVSPMTNAHCGMATLPIHGPFFVTRPTMALNLGENCIDSMGDTIVHEVLHLTGVKEAEQTLLDDYTKLAESCYTSQGLLDFDNSERAEFFNSTQVETRMLIFRKVRDESVEKWGFLPAERDFVLGTLCSAMGDRSCSRKFFEQAASGQLMGTVVLPEGQKVSWSALGQYMLYDETIEDIYRMRMRMRELAKYLRKDPEGIIIKRNEYSGTRLHEYFVVRTALEKIKANRNVCDDSTDDRVFCEDTNSISKTQWFKNQ